MRLHFFHVPPRVHLHLHIYAFRSWRGTALSLLLWYTLIIEMVLLARRPMLISLARMLMMLCRKALLPLVAAFLLFPRPATAADQDLNTALMESTFRISGPAEISDAVSAGTVFFLNRPSAKASGKPAPIMVTAAHVLAGIAGDDAVLLLRKRTQDNGFISFEYPIKIRDRGVPLWTGHPDVDVAVLSLTLPAEAHVSLLSPDLLAMDETIARYEIHPGDELLSLGYPSGLPANAAGFPILRSGKIASYPIIPAKKYRTFLYDSQIHSGNSGGPVYFTASSRTYGGSHTVREISFIVGLVSRQAIVEGRPLELAAVIPAQFIREAIEMLAGSRPAATKP